jgi:hypothetical protein
MIEEIFILFLIYSQIWLNLPPDDRHFDCKQNFLKNHTDPQMLQCVSKKWVKLGTISYTNLVGRFAKSYLTKSLGSSEEGAKEGANWGWNSWEQQFQG